MNLLSGLFATGDSGMKLSYVWDKATPEAKVIILVLAIFSIFAWAVMLTKAQQMRRAKRLNHYFESEYRGQKSVLGIYDRKLPVPERGPIQLQTHGGEIRWRNVFIREIGGDEAAKLLRGH